MSEPTITCPKCKAEIKLTDSLAAPLVEATRLQYEAKLNEQGADIAKRENELAANAAKVREAQLHIETEVADKLANQLLAARANIVNEESRRAKLAAQSDIDAKSRELVDLQAVLTANNDKLAQAQLAQAEFAKKERLLADERRELELTVEKKVQDGLNEVRLQAQYAAEDAMKYQVAEKEMTIKAMQEQIEGLKRRAEQGSQQAQGEAMELELEALLKTKFPFDDIQPVPKGEYGGDVVHRVAGMSGQTSGTILWEFKNTKVFMDAWLPKLRGDQRTAKAEIAVIVTTALPKGVETFDMIDGVWVCSPRTAVPVAMVLRQSLMDVSAAKQSQEGQAGKAELVYNYLTGPRFKLRVEAIVEAFSTMQEDLDKERKAIMRQWAKRDEQIARTLDATVGMYGDLQGIAGKPLQEISGLSMATLGVTLEDDEL